MRVIGIDLAWAEGSDSKAANETGYVALDPSGQIADAGWTTGVPATADRVSKLGTRNTLVFVDAPLVVDNARGQRLCEKQVGQRYMRWKVAANSTHMSNPRLAGVALLRQLEAAGWRYNDGRDGPPSGGRVVSECYPFTTLVGAREFGHPSERPLYKRKPKGMTIVDFRPVRARACDGVVASLDRLETADPPLDLGSHPATASLALESSPLDDRAYKHREDLIDAAICAWTGMLWLRHGLTRCQVLGLPPGQPERAATIIAPTRSSPPNDRLEN